MINIIRNLNAMEIKQNQNNAHDSSNLKKKFNEIIEKIKTYANNNNKKKVIKCINSYLKRNIYIYDYSVQIQENEINIAYDKKKYTIKSYENIESIDKKYHQNKVKKILLALEYFISMKPKEIEQLLSREWRLYYLLLNAIFATEIKSDIKSSAWHMKNILHYIKSFTQSTNQNDYNQYKDLINNLLYKAIITISELIPKIQTDQNTYKELYEQALETVQELKDNISFAQQDTNLSGGRAKEISLLILLNNLGNMIIMNKPMIMIHEPTSRLDDKLENVYKTVLRKVKPSLADLYLGSSSKS